MKLFRRFKQIKKIKNMKFRGMGFLTVLEMFFSLLMIPCGLAFVSAMNPGATENARDVFGLMMAQYLLLALATFFRAVQRRYRHQIPMRRKVDFISSGVFLLCAVALNIWPFSPLAWKITGVIFLLSLIPSRVLSILRNRKWYRVALNGAVIALILYFCIGIWFEQEPETPVAFAVVIMLLISIRSFARIMTVTFARLRLDLLRDIVKQTYAAEIIFGLVLLIVSFSWVLMYMDPAFTHFSDALWYCFAVVTTIGFGDMTATSTVGRILSVILGIYGIVVVALITSVVVNFYGEMKKAEPGEEEALPEGAQAAGNPPEPPAEEAKEQEN